MTAAAQTPRRANNRRPRIIIFRLPVTAERDDRRLPRAWPPARRPPARYATDDVGVRGTCLCSLSAVASDRTTCPDNTEWSGGPERLPGAAKIHRFFRLDRFPFAAERGTANAGGGERLMAAPVPAAHVAHREPRPPLDVPADDLVSQLHGPTSAEDVNLFEAGWSGIRPGTVLSTDGAAPPIGGRLGYAPRGLSRAVSRPR